MWRTTHPASLLLQLFAMTFQSKFDQLVDKTGNNNNKKNPQTDFEGKT